MSEQMLRGDFAGEEDYDVRKGCGDGYPMNQVLELKYTADLFITNGVETGGEFRLHESLDDQSAEELLHDLLAPLERGASDWKIDLTEPDFLNSFTLGILVKIHSIVKKYSGTVKFVIREGSPLNRTLEISNLTKILDIDLV